MEGLSFMIQGDSEGDVTFECPFCHSEFKLQAGEFQDDDKALKTIWILLLSSCNLNIPKRVV